MKNRILMATLAIAFAGCASVPGPWRKKAENAPEAVPAPTPRELVANDPRDVPPVSSGANVIWQQALAQPGTRIIVSTEGRSLWLVRDSTVLFKAPIAVGRNKRLMWKGKEYDFTTPVGKRKVLKKGLAPKWTPPDWHYYEIAQDQGLEPVFLKKKAVVTLADSTRIEVRRTEVGRVNRFGNFWPFTPGKEIIFDGKVYIPPIGTDQRMVPDVLGTHKLEMGSGYLIHGTNEEGSIGEAVSHGCIRMYNDDVAQLYDLVGVGTPVYIY